MRCDEHYLDGKANVTDSSEPTQPPSLLVGTTPQGFPIVAYWKPEGEREETRIHLTTADPRFVASNGQRGLHLIFEGVNQGSASYDPKRFNAIRSALVEAGVPAPEKVPDLERHLSSRLDLVRPRKITVDGMTYVRAD